MTLKTPTRIYLVRGAQRPRLVRAINASQALRHVAADTLRVGVASQDDLVSLVAAGTAVEDTSREAAQLELQEA